MKILVTGGLGFIGSNFILHVLKNYPEIEVINLDAGFIGSNIQNLKEIENSTKYEFVSGNINDKETVEKMIKNVDGGRAFLAMHRQDGKN